MAVGVNLCVNLPLGYFLIKSLDTFQGVNAMFRTRVFSDSVCAIGSMAKVLDANLTYGTKFQSWFINFGTNYKVYIFYDPSRMLNLVKKTVDDKGIVFDEDGNKIKRSYIKILKKCSHRKVYIPVQSSL